MFDASGNPIHFTLVRTTDATVEPVSLESMKQSLRVDSNTDDALIEQYITAARHAVDAATRRTGTHSTFTMTLDVAPARRASIWLPVSPVASVTSIKSFSTADVESTVSSSVYRLDASSTPARIVLRDGQEWPTGLRPQNALQIIFVAGYGAAASDITDHNYIHAVRLLSAHWYEQREPIVLGESAQELPLAYQTLVDSVRMPWL